MYRHDYVNNPIYDRHLIYDVLYHTDLSRDKGTSNGIDLALNKWENYDLVVIDESHNFRNGGSSESDQAEGRENRYSRLMNRIIKSGVPTKVLMLSATPVNNRFNDLKNQIALAYEGDVEQIDGKLDTQSSINDIFRNAQLAYNKWADLPAEERTTDKLLSTLDFDFFKVLDSVTIARSRKHIREFYDRKAIGDFPERLKPRNFEPDLTVSKREKYEITLAGNKANLTQLGRESGMKKLMMINLLKRLESSVAAFRYTLIDVVKSYVDETLKAISTYEQTGLDALSGVPVLNEDDFDIEDSNLDVFIGKKNRIALKDMDYHSWKLELEKDQAILLELEELIDQITPAEDKKLQTLYQLIDEKMTHPINEGNKKLIIFSAFATTTNYLYKHISQYVLDKYGLHTAQISGTKGFETTLKTNHRDLNSLLTYFSPQSKDRNLLFPDDQREIDVLIATDVISEGQNLQDADMMVNYDIHWNPVRIIQRFGRVDRIGSKNKFIQLVNFWPNIELDEYIDLKSRVESRMKISVLTSTADDNVLSSEEVEDNNYRKKQLERLRNEVVDLEEMSEGISIMDLGLEDYRMDLLKYLESHPELEKVPKGLQAILSVENKEAEGSIFVLKNKDELRGKNQKNQLHPYYILYVNSAGDLVVSPEESKKILDLLGSLCRGKTQPLQSLVNQYNRQTKDGQEMSGYSKLLQQAIEQLMEQDQLSTMDALFNFGTVNLMNTSIEGMDDFELICFFALLQGGSYDTVS